MHRAPFYQAQAPPNVPHQQNVIRLQPAMINTGLSKFDPAECSFSTWVQQFEEFCFLNGIQPEPPVVNNIIPPHNKKRALFLTHVGTRALELLRKRCAPYQPNQFPIEALMHTLRQHFEKPELQATYRFQLMSRVQKPGETLEDYVSELQDLGAKCNFGDHLDERLRDRFVSGANLPTPVRTHLLSHPEMTFEEMGNYAQNA